jgi:hypothetical protein
MNVRWERRSSLAMSVLVLLGSAACETGSKPVPHIKPVERPVVYFQRAPIHGWQAVDWTGTIAGPIGSDHVGIPYQSPDGSRLIWSPQSEWQFADRTGKTLSRLDLARSRSFAWADDAAGMCVVRDNPPNGGSYQLDFEAATGGSRKIASFSTSSGPNVVACSHSAGRAVIATASRDITSGAQVTFGQLIVIDLTTGAAQTSPIGSFSPAVTSLAVSHDGAESALATSTQTMILNLLTGAYTRLVPSLTPLAFSWDGSMLVGATSSNRGAAVNVSTGQMIWSENEPQRITQGAIPDPAGGGLMLVTTTGGLNDLVVISPTGAERTIAKAVFPAQVAPCYICSAV